MTARVDVDSGFEGFDEGSLIDPPLDPVIFIGQDGLVLFAEMVAIVACVLQHC